MSIAIKYHKFSSLSVSHFSFSLYKLPTEATLTTVCEVATEGKGKYGGEVVLIPKCFLSHIFSMKTTETNYTVNDQTTGGGGRADGMGRTEVKYNQFPLR